MLDDDISLLDAARVGDCMRHGIISCDGTTLLAEVAAIMAGRGVHAVLVTGESGRIDGVISDLELVTAATRPQAVTAAEAVARHPLWISAERSLRQAAVLMAEHAVRHLLVRDHGSGHPLGVLSSSDIVSAYAAAAQEAPS